MAVLPFGESFKAPFSTLYRPGRTFGVRRAASFLLLCSLSRIDPCLLTPFLFYLKVAIMSMPVYYFSEFRSVEFCVIIPLTQGRGGCRIAEWLKGLSVLSFGFVRLWSRLPKICGANSLLIILGYPVGLPTGIGLALCWLAGRLSK